MRGRKDSCTAWVRARQQNFSFIYFLMSSSDPLSFLCNPYLNSCAYSHIIKPHKINKNINLTIGNINDI